MPKSKRDKKVSLTKSTKKGLKEKQKLVEEIRKSIDNYKFLYVFTTPNMRNGQLKGIRADLKKDSRFFFGKNRVMVLGLGKKKSEEVEKDLHLVSKYVKGQCGLLFTNKPKDEIKEYFDSYSAVDYARAGFVATETVVLPEGPLPDFPHSMEPQLRQLGLSTSLQRGVVTLTKEHTVCKQGKPLTPEQARILIPENRRKGFSHHQGLLSPQLVNALTHRKKDLNFILAKGRVPVIGVSNRFARKKLIDKKMAEFRVLLLCMWSKKGFTSFTKDGAPPESTDSGVENEEESMDED